MKRLLAATALLLAAPLHGQAVDPAAAIAAAVSDAGRPPAEVARDIARKPAAILAFARVAPGQKIGDFVMGGGYFTRLFAKAVGPTGKVYAFQPSEFIGFRPAYAEEQKTVVAAYANVVPVTTKFADVGFAEPLDLIFTAQNYHDLHLAPFPADTAAKVNAALFAALKPGGVLVVIDHVAAPGSGLRDANTLHRIDPPAARAELEAAGFVFEAEDPMLRDPADPHTANVFDPKIRGKTDQFVHRYRKPG